MRFSTLFTTLALSLSASALLLPAQLPLSPFFDLSAPSTLYDNHLSVPGDNPLKYCQDPVAAKYKLLISNVDVLPNPPIAGKNLTVAASGTISDTIDTNATVSLLVKYGLITIIKQTHKLCDLVQNVDWECPIKPGVKKIEKEIALPNEIPPGRYTVQADVFDQHEERLTCLTGTVTFKLIH